MEIDFGSGPEEQKVLCIAVLSRTDPERAKAEIGNYLKGEGDRQIAYKLLPLKFLEESKLVDGQAVKALARTNTKRFFVQKRALSIKDDVKAYGLLYSTLVQFIENPEKDVSRLLKCIFNAVEPLKAIDILSGMLLLPKLPFEHEKMVEFFYILSTSKSKLSSLFVKNAFRLKNDFLNKILLRKFNYDRETFQLLAEADYEFCKSNFRNFSSNKTLLREFFKQTSPRNFLEYEKYFCAEIVLDNLEKINLNEALKYSATFKSKSIFAAYWKIFSAKKTSLRFAYYEKLSENENAFENTKKLLKRLSLSNVELIYTKMEDLIYESPISYFKAVIETIYSYDTLLSVIEKIFVLLSPIFLDILYFCILNIFISRYDFVDNDLYSKWYLNLCSLFEMISPFVQLEATYLLLNKFLEMKKFAYLHILEVIVSKYLEIRKNESLAAVEIKNNLKIPDVLVEQVGEAINNLFAHESFSLKVKIDLSERYRKMFEILGSKPPYKMVLTLGSLKYLTPYEIKKEANMIDVTDLNNIINEYKEHISDDFFMIKNFVLLINIKQKDVEDINWVVGYLKTIGTSQREDLKVLSESCLSNIFIDEKNSKRLKVNEIPGSGVKITITDNKTINEAVYPELNASEATKKSPTKKDLEEGEILEK